MRTTKTVMGVLGVILITAGCELGNQPVNYGGDILFQENFEGYEYLDRPDDWDYEDDPEANYGPSSWFVVDTENSMFNMALEQRSDIGGGGGFGNATYYGTTALAGDETWTDYRLEVDFSTSDSDGVGFDFRKNNQVGDGSGYYRLFFMNNNLNGGPFVKLLYYDGISLQTYVLAEKMYVSFEPGVSWHNVKITAIGSNIQCVLDGTVLFDITDNHISHGRIGLFCCYMNAGVRFDNIVVIAQDEGTPTNGNLLVG